MSLENASDDVKLAVDILELLAVNEIAPDVAISALTLALSDLKKQMNQSDIPSKDPL